MKKKTACGSAAVVAAVLACDSTKVDEPLTLGQATAVLRELMDLTEWAEEGTHMVRCSLGGGAKVDYEEMVGGRGDTIQMLGKWILAPDSCELTALGDTLVLEGAPSVIFKAEFRYFGFREDGEYDLVGAGTVTWTRGENDSGDCKVDVALEGGRLNPSTGDIDGNVTGSLCGLDVKIHYSEL